MTPTYGRRWQTASSGRRSSTDARGLPCARRRTLPMSVVFVARQQIFDRAARLVGYELLYRPTASAFEKVSRDDSLRMTGATIVTAVLSIGLDQITGKTPAWINFPREMLLRHDFELLDPR